MVTAAHITESSIDSLAAVGLDELFGTTSDSLWRAGASRLPAHPAPVHIGPTKSQQQSSIENLPNYVAVLHDATVASAPFGSSHLMGNRHVVEGGQVVVRSNGTILPDSLWRNRYLPGEFIAPDGEHLTRLPALEANETLGGSFLYLGRHFNHFGHLIIDASARLWPLAHSDQRWTEMPIIYGGDVMDETSLGLFASLGIERHRLIHHSGVSKVERVFLPSLGFQFGVGSSARFDRLWTGLALPDSPNAGERIFLSRSAWERSTEAARPMQAGQSEHLDELFADRGFTIIHPQTHPLIDQFAIASGASMLAGCVGSANHLVIAAAQAPPHLVVSPAGATNWVDMAIHAAKGSAPALFEGAYAQDVSSDSREQRLASWRLDLEVFEAALDGWLEAAAS